MRITTSTQTATILKVAELGLTHHLYSSNGFFRRIFIKKKEHIRLVAVAWRRKEPIGIALVLKKGIYFFNFGVYVKPEFRRKGIGTQLAKRAIRRLKRQGLTVDVSDHRGKFYSNVGQVSRLGNGKAKLQMKRSA